MNRKVLYLPLAIFLILAAALMWQLMRNSDGDDPTVLESALVGKPLPDFRLASLEKPDVMLDPSNIINGKPVLINVWATWCPTCRAEHQYLRSLAAQGIRIVGINYKDDRQKAVNWLHELGNPYGAPETFLIDGKGIIRYRHAGDVNERVWQQEILPLWNKYSQQGGA